MRQPGRRRPRRGPAQAWHRASQSMLQSQFSDPLLDLGQRQKHFDAWYRKVHAASSTAQDGTIGPPGEALARRAIRRGSVVGHGRGRVETTPIEALIRSPTKPTLGPRRRSGGTGEQPASASEIRPCATGQALPRHHGVAAAWNDELWWRSWKWRGV